jgi:hypothetical protein
VERPTHDDDGVFLQPEMVSREDAARLAHVTVRMVRDWQFRGLLQVRARVRRSPYYNMHEVWAVELFTRTSARGRPRGADDQANYG